MPTPANLVWIVGCLGCGRAAFDRLPDAGDASTVDAPRFGEPRPLTELETAGQERDPTLTDDLLEIYFAVHELPAGDANIWHATRVSTEALFGAPAVVPALSTGAWEDTPTIAPDGLTIYFARGGSMADMYVATRPTRTSPWTTPVEITELTTPTVDAPATLLNGGLKLYVSRGPSGSTDIFTSERSSVTAAWQTPVLVAELSSSGSDSDAAVTSTDLEIYFSRNNGTHLDLMYARRSTTGEPFGEPQPLAELNSNTDESDPWPLPRGGLIFSSARDGSRRLYEALKP